MNFPFSQMEPLQSTSRRKIQHCATFLNRTLIFNSEIRNCFPSPRSANSNLLLYNLHFHHFGEATNQLNLDRFARTRKIRLVSSAISLRTLRDLEERFLPAGRRLLQLSIPRARVNQSPPASIPFVLAICIATRAHLDVLSAPGDETLSVWHCSRHLQVPPSRETYQFERLFAYVLAALAD